VAFSSRRVTILRLNTVANAIARPDQDDLAVLVLFAAQLFAVTPGLPNSVDLGADSLCFANWLVAAAAAVAAQTAALREPARADLVEPTEDAAPIAADAPVLIAEPTIAIVAAAAAGCRRPTATIVAAIGRPVAAPVAPVARADSATDAIVALATAVAAAVY